MKIIQIHNKLSVQNCILVIYTLSRLLNMSSIFDIKYVTICIVISFIYSTFISATLKVENMHITEKRNMYVFVNVKTH